MFGTAFGSFLEPKDSFDSQACWTIHQRREGQTFVESSHFVLRKKKKNNNNCRPPWRLWKNPQSFTILQLASMVGTPRKNTIDQSTLVKLTVRMLDCFTLRNGSHASARFYWGCRQGLSQKEASKNRLGCMRFDWPNKSLHVECFHWGWRLHWCHVRGSWMSSPSSLKQPKDARTVA